MSAEAQPCARAATKVRATAPPLLSRLLTGSARRRSYATPFNPERMFDKKSTVHFDLKGCNVSAYTSNPHHPFPFGLFQECF
jgi:hypothetical protein